MPLRIVYMGSPEFALGPLEHILNSGYRIAAVVTVPDKPSGRGQKLTFSPVKRFALSHNIPVLQPDDLSEQSFTEQLRAYAPDLQIIVAFRIIPESIWKLPPLGTFNLHASLLPQYRGAAPINWSLINGEAETGVTTFFLSQPVDTGNIIFQEKTPVHPEETAGELHDRLMEIGSALVLKTVQAIESGTVTTTDQRTLVSPGMVLHRAPKLTKDDCRIDWGQPSEVIRNRIRGLSPVPGAFTLLGSTLQDASLLKIYRASAHPAAHGSEPGKIVTDSRTHFGITTSDGIVYLQEVQLASKKRMHMAEFLKGFLMPHGMQTF